MRLLGAKIVGFRGLREFQTHFPEQQPTFFFGMNGVGKSSLFQAIHFALTDELAPINAIGAAPAYTYRHKGLGEQDSASVKVAFSVAGTTHWIRRSIDANGTVTTTASSPAAVSAAKSSGAGLAFLTRADFAAMVDAADRDCWDRLTPFLGFDRLAKFREGLRSLTRNLRRDLRFNARREHVEAQKRDVSLKQESVDALVVELQLPGADAAVVLAALRALHLEIEADAELSDLPWDQLESQLDIAVRARNAQQALSVAQAFASSLPDSFFDPERITPAIEIASELGLSEAKRHLLVHGRFLETAAVVVADFRDQSCPLCHLTPRDWQPIRIRVNQGLHEAAQLTGEVADALQTARSCGEALRRFRDALASAPEPIRDAAQTVAFSNEVAALDNGIQRLREVLEAQPPAGLSQQEADPLLQATMSAPPALVEFRSWLLGHVEELRIHLETLSTSDVLRRFFKLKELVQTDVAMKEARASICQEELTLQRLDALIGGVRGLYQTVDEAEEDLNARVLTSLQADVQSTFVALTGQSSMMPVVELTASHGVRRAKLKIRDFHGLGPVGARDYLSESYRNALGLSLYFSGFGLRSPGAEFFLLDDVTHSADSEHRRGLASYLVGTLAQNLQLVVLTHDDNWFARLRTLAGSGARCIRVYGWRIDGLAVREDPWVTHLDDADSRIVAGDRTGGNALRLALESLVSDTCEMLSVKVPFKRRAHQVKFDVKRRALVAALTQARDSGGFIDPQSAPVLLLQNSQHITNLASHDGTFDAWTQADLLDALGDVRDISQLLTCSNSHGSNRCGGRLRQLSLQNGNPPQCRTCGQPFGV